MRTKLQVTMTEEQLCCAWLRSDLKERLALYDAVANITDPSANVYTYPLMVTCALLYLPNVHTLTIIVHH